MLQNTYAVRYYNPGEEQADRALKGNAIGGSIPAKDKRSGKVEEVGSSVARQTFFTRRRIQPRKMSPRKHNSTHIAIHTPRNP